MSTLSEHLMVVLDQAKEENKPAVIVLLGFCLSALKGEAVPETGEAKLWEMQRYGKDHGERTTSNEIINRLKPHVLSGDEKSFVEEIDRLFLGGAWGFIFELLDETPGGYHWRTFAGDIRGLVWACLQEG